MEELVAILRIGKKWEKNKLTLQYGLEGIKMGNPDLIIIINGLAFLIKSQDYDTRNEAVLIMISRFEDYWKKTKEVADKPEELTREEEIKEIKVYELQK